MYLNKAIAFSILCFLYLSINAQVIDDFSNPILNPIWQGQSGLFTISGGKLKSNGPNSTAQSIYLTAPIITSGNAEWQFLVDLGFAPSSTNLFRFYLSSNNSNLASTLSGYYIEIGESNQDRINIFRQNGNVKTKIFSTTGFCFSSATANYTNVRIKTTRDNLGNWTVFSDCSGGNSFTNQGSFTDNAIALATIFGINCVYGTASRRNLFAVDDIYVGDIQTNNMPPSVTGINVLANNKLLINFSEPISIVSGTLVGNYLVNNGITNPTNATFTTSSSIILSFSNTFSNSNTITISGLKDLYDNQISSTVLDFQYVITTSSSNNSTPKNYRDIVINELMADINPVPDGIPAYEYIELFNNTNQTVNLYGDTLIDGNVKRIFTRNFTIAGNGFGVLVSSEAARQEFVSSFPEINIYTLSGLGLTDGGETFTLKNAGGTIIDKVSYKISWYKDSNKSKGGFSIEQINPKSPCSGEANWMASNDAKGGTPGNQNSVFSSSINAPKIVNLITKSTSQIEIVFNQPMDTTSFKTADYQLGSAISASPTTFTQDTLWLLPSINLTLGKPYSLTIAGAKNCEGIELSGNIFTIGLPRLPQSGEIIINEIMAEPEPQVQLPIAEYIELYNTTNELIDVSNFKLKDATVSSNGKIAANTVILPKNYLVLCSESNSGLFPTETKIAKVSGFPSLNKTGDYVAILDLNSTIIDKITYKPDWYRDEIKADGGWSLERINPGKNCGGKYNWTASVDNKGGTPGAVNSVFSISPDKAKPLVNNVIINSIASLSIVFNEGMDTLNLSSGFGVSGKNIDLVSLSNLNSDTAFVSLNTPLDLGKTYTFQAQNLFDCSGNKLDFYTQTIGIGRKPKAYEVVINEIMADETPVQKLPEAEFVELFNNTNDLINLSNFRLFDATTIPGKFPANVVLKPNGYMILCSTSKVNDFKPYGETYGISSFPSLNSSGDFLKLVSPENITISKINYLDSWYKDEIKKDGGWSLEQIDPLNPCGTANNWIASSDVNGGTPGKINSDFAINPDNEAPKLIQAFATSKDSLLLYFNEPIDSSSATKAVYTISNGIQSQIISIETDRIYLGLHPSLTLNQLYQVSVSQIQDCVGNFIEAGGNTKSFYQAEKADSFDIIINEVLFNPRTGGSDFVEVYNRSTKNINLKNWQFANVEHNDIKNFKPITAENLLILPKSYKVFTDNPANIKNNYPNSVDSNFIQLKNLPSYNDDEGTVVLANQTSRIIDYFHYLDNYHLSLIDNKEGISLERVNSDLPTNTPENWASASQNAGYATPGFRNSQQINFEISDKIVDITPKVFSPDQDGYLDFTTITFNSQSINNVANITIYDLEGRIIRKLVRNQNIGNQSFFQWDGLDDIGRKASVGNYLVYVEIFNLKGETKSYKENVVVAARF